MKIRSIYFIIILLSFQQKNNKLTNKIIVTKFLVLLDRSGVGRCIEEARILTVARQRAISGDILRLRGERGDFDLALEPMRGQMVLGTVGPQRVTWTLDRGRGLPGRG